VPLAFRTADLGDVETIVDLVQAAYRGESSRAGWTTEAHLLDGDRTNPDAVRAMITGAGSRMLVAVRGGGIEACCQLEDRPGGAYFGTFAVQPGSQGSGTGAALLGEAERRAGAGGARWMELTVIAQRLDLIAWYERRGYVRTGERRPFPYDDERFGIPLRPDLEFAVFRKPLV